MKNSEFCKFLNLVMLKMNLERIYLKICATTRKMGEKTTKDPKDESDEKPLAR